MVLTLAHCTDGAIFWKHVGLVSWIFICVWCGAFVGVMKANWSRMLEWKT